MNNMYNQGAGPPRGHMGPPVGGQMMGGPMGGPPMGGQMGGQMMGPGYGDAPMQWGQQQQWGQVQQRGSGRDGGGVSDPAIYIVT